MAADEASPDIAPLREWFESQGEVRSVRATFVQERRLRTLKRPIRDTGRLWFEAPWRFRWELGSPVRMLAVQSTEHEVTVVEPRRKRATILDLHDPANRERFDRLGFLRPGATQDPDEFEKAFTLRRLVRAGDVIECELGFRDRRLAAAVLKVTMRIDVARDRFDEFAIHFRDQSTISVRFEQVERNVTIEPDIFRVDLSGLSIERA